jgi:hypothetical protein
MIDRQEARSDVARIDPAADRCDVINDLTIQTLLKNLIYTNVVNENR